MFIEIELRSEGERRIMEALGLAVLGWQSVEMQMEIVFSNATSMDKYTTSQMLSKVHTFALRLELLEVVVAPKMVDEEWTAKWREICSYLRELSGDRNYLVHNGLVTEYSPDGDHPYKIGITSKKRNNYSREEIIEVAEDFHHAWLVLLLIDSCVRNGQSSDDKHRALKVRRRPSRTQRREADQRKPPRQR